MPVCRLAGYTTVYAMKQAMEKAKAVDMEKVINALEGMELNTVVGKIQIRACDHQTLWPFWVGPVTVTADLPWPHVTKPVLLDPAKGYLTCAEIEAARKKRFNCRHYGSRFIFSSKHRIRG